MSEYNINIKNLKYESIEVGRFIKSSKCIYTWEFVLEDVKRKIELIHSRITGKRKIFLDGKNILDAQKYTYEFTHTFRIGNHYLNLLQTAPDIYEIKIDNITFTNLMNRENREKIKKMKNEQTKKIENLNKNDEKAETIINKVKKNTGDDFAIENKFSDTPKNHLNNVKESIANQHEGDFFDNKGDWDFDFDNNDGNQRIAHDINNNLNDFDFNSNKNKKNKAENNDNMFVLGSSKNEIKNNSFFPNHKTDNIISFDNQPGNKSTNVNNNLIDINDIFNGSNSNHTNLIYNQANSSNNTNVDNNMNKNLLDLNLDFGSANTNPTTSIPLNNNMDFFNNIGSDFSTHNVKSNTNNNINFSDMNLDFNSNYVKNKISLDPNTNINNKKNETDFNFHLLDKHVGTMNLTDGNSRKETNSNFDFKF